MLFVSVLVLLIYVFAIYGTAVVKYLKGPKNAEKDDPCHIKFNATVNIKPLHDDEGPEE